jgi:UrcA family protein
MNSNTKVLAVPGGARGFYLNRMLSAAAAAVLTVVWLAAAQPAHADEYAVKTTTVKYGDLNLQSEAGARALYRRLQSAAARVCGDDYRSFGWRQCYQKALSGAVDDVGAPTLMAVHHATRVSGASSG